MSTSNTPITIDRVICWARSGNESGKVYRFLFLNPEDLFTIPNGRRWSIAHQIVYNGDVILLQRVLGLFNDDEININTLSTDHKTLLDVAKERQNQYPKMFTSIENLFHQNSLIKVAKSRDWNSVVSILEQNPKLANEKPPYESYFLLHYVVQNDRETPYALAKRLNKITMCSLLQQMINERSISLSNEDFETENTGLTKSMTTMPGIPHGEKDQYLIGFQNILLDITENGDFSIDKQYLSSPHSISSSDQSKSIENSNNNNQFFPSITENQLRKKITCSIIKLPLIDPVIASDGQTYERESIIQWIKQHHCSPVTGEPMNLTLRDNTELLEIIQSMSVGS